MIEVDYVGGGCTSGLAIRRVRWLVFMGTTDPEWRPAPDAADGGVRRSAGCWTLVLLATNTTQSRGTQVPAAQSATSFSLSMSRTAADFAVGHVLRTGRAHARCGRLGPHTGTLPGPGTLAELADKGTVLCEHSRAALLDGGGAGVGEGVHGGHLNLVVVCDPVEDGQGMY